MVQLRASLEVLVLQAWRDRWSNLEWSINLKQALSEDDSELNQLCAMLLRQATLSEVPNVLMFSYMQFTMAAKVVSHSSFLEAIVDYRDFGRHRCVEAILEQLNLNRDKFSCNSVDAFDCERLCELLSQLIGWFLDAIEHTIHSLDDKLLNELLITALSYLTSPFVAFCLFFDSLVNPAVIRAQIEHACQLRERLVESATLPDIASNEMQTFHRKLTSIPQYATPRISPDGLCELSPGTPHPALITLSAVYGCFRVTEKHDRVASMLMAVRNAILLPWWLVINDLIRGAFLVQLDPGTTTRDSTIAAFIYLKIPRILKHFVDNGEVDKLELIRALEHVAVYHSLLNSLDMRTKFNCYQNLLDQLKTTDLLNEDDCAQLNNLRNKDRIGMIELSPTNQQGIQLVLRAEGTVTTLERIFNNEMAFNPQKLVQMMSHMILSGGKSFDYICASSAATGKLAGFAGKLALFNANSERPSSQNDNGKVRATMFDLSFLLLSRIRCLYSDLKLSDLVGIGDEFRSSCFYKWSSSYGDSVDSSSLARESVNVQDKSDFADDFALLKQGKAFWNVDHCDYAQVIAKIPIIGELMLDECRDESAKESAQLQTLLSSLNGDVSGLLICLVQWLYTQSKSSRRSLLAVVLERFFSSIATSNDDHQQQQQQQSRVDERWRFMVTTAQWTLNLLLSEDRPPSPPYTWIIHCARLSLPSTSSRHLPDDDGLKQAFTFAHRQNWVGPNVLSLLDRCNKSAHQRRWCSVWVRSFLKLYTADELRTAAGLCIGAAMLSPSDSLGALVHSVVDYVFEKGHELFCVAPRGVILAQFLVQSLVLAVHVQNDNDNLACMDIIKEEGPSKAKRIKNEDEIAECPAESDIMATDNVVTGEDAVNALFARFLRVTADGDLQPTVFFVVSFLRSLSELRSSAAKRIISLLPHHLLLQVIRTDPKCLSPSVILALYNLDDQQNRRRALQNICLLRHLRAL